jgi:hypothetical protein
MRHAVSVRRDGARAMRFGRHATAGPTPSASVTVESVAASSDGSPDAGRLAMIALIVVLNAGAFALFFRTIGGAARHPR